MARARAAGRWHPERSAQCRRIRGAHGSSGHGVRYTPANEYAQREMLARIGADSIEALFAPVPEHLRRDVAVDVPGPLAEADLIRRANDLAALNVAARRPVSFLGGGAYDHFVPAFVRTLMSRSEY